MFEGSVDDLQESCKEIGYARDPVFSDCLASFDVESENACYVRDKLKIIMYFILIISICYV